MANIFSCINKKIHVYILTDTPYMMQRRTAIDDEVRSSQEMSKNDTSEMRKIGRWEDSKGS